MPATLVNETGSPSRSATAGLAAAATITAKATNQDACAVAQAAQVPLSSVIVADGLGSHFGAEVSSAMATARMKAIVEDLTSLDNLDVGALFADVLVHLEADIPGPGVETPDDLDRDNAYGTTLLCAIETPLQWRLGYVGNGAMYHIRGNFSQFPASQLLPWNAINYLNPHTVSQGGKNALYRYMSPFAGASRAAPTLLDLSKDRSGFGDIVMVCSDGVSSYDQTPMGRDSDKRIWISGEPSMILFYQHLKSFLAGRDYSNPALRVMLDAYLADLQAHALVTDDCTVGVLISEPALRYHEGLRDMTPEVE